MRKYGKDLKIGDTIKVWWAEKDMITDLKTEGCIYATFVSNKSGMTIWSGQVYEVISELPKQ